MNRKIAALGILLFFSVTIINAQLDPTFGTGGVTTTNVSGAGADSPLAGFLLPDSKILIVAKRENFNNPPTFDYYFLRYNNDGTLDSTYGNGGKVLLPITSPFGINNFSRAVMQHEFDDCLYLGNVGRHSGAGKILNSTEAENKRFKGVFNFPFSNF